MTQANPASLSRIILILAAAVIVIAGIKAAAGIVIPFLCATFIAVLCLPAFNAMRRRRVPDAIALCSVLGGLVLIAVAVMVLLGSSLNSFRANLKTYEISLTAYANDVNAQLIEWKILPPDSDQKKASNEEKQDDNEELTDKEKPGAKEESTDNGNSSDDDNQNGEQKPIATKKPEGTSSGTSSGMNWFSSPHNLIAFVRQTLEQISSLMGSAFIIFLMLSFLLAEAATFGAKIRSVSRDPELAAARVRSVTEGISRYFNIKTAISLGTGLAVGIFLWILGVDFPFLWAFLAFLLNFVPNIGSVMAAIPPTAIALVQPDGGGLSLALSVMAGFAVINIVIGSVLEPRFLGRGLDLSTLVVFLSLLFWGWVLGPIGMLLSVPLTMTVKIVFEAFPETEGIAVMLRGSAPETPSSQN